jgi:quercetin dioxygenase-like cupin family protein
MNKELSTNFIESLEELQDVFIENNNIEGIYGDGKSLVNNEEFPITNNFTDGLYMRQMKMKAGSFVISAMHHTNHFWFLLSGKVIVQADNETVEHIAPCWSYSLKGTKRLIKCIEDCVWINIIANPSNTKDMKEIESNFFSATLEEYNKKEKLCQE